MLVPNKSTLRASLEIQKCKTYFFIADTKESGTWKHVWKTQAALLQWTRTNGNNSVATGSSWGWGLHLDFYILRSCDKYVLFLFLMSGVTEQQFQTLHFLHCSASQQWLLTHPKQEQVPVPLPHIMCKAPWLHHKCFSPVASERRDLKPLQQNLASYLLITESSTCNSEYLQFNSNVQNSKTLLLLPQCT